MVVTAGMAKKEVVPTREGGKEVCKGKNIWHFQRGLESWCEKDSF